MEIGRQNFMYKYPYPYTHRTFTLLFFTIRCYDNKDNMTRNSTRYIMMSQLIYFTYHVTNYVNA
jgi:hypothetical protein